MEIERIVDKFEKIIGPVARMLALKTAEELGLEIRGNEIMVEGREEEFKSKYKEKVGKIIGEEVAETIMQM